MAIKLWQKHTELNDFIEQFTIGQDRDLDVWLAPYDILGSMAHIRMLHSVGLLPQADLAPLLLALHDIYLTTQTGSFVIAPGVEDVHSQVELLLTERLGDLGKKIHSGRSRNDQVLLDLKLYLRYAIAEIVTQVKDLFDTLQTQSETYKHVLLPGYTHLQVAMPSSFGLWFGAYAEALTDDLQVLQGVYHTVNRNPLGSAAGYGSSFPLDREMTTQLLGFAGLNYNVVYAQMGRGKTERNVAQALAGIAATVAKMAFDACLYSSQNFGFIHLPDNCTTGSSIMPHKKNPDVFELIRAKCNKIQGVPQQLTLIINNLPSGYFRDLQITKEVLLPVFEELSNCLQMATYIMQRITVNTAAAQDAKYHLMYSVEEVNRRVLAGVPFRDAYLQVGLEIEQGSFVPPAHVQHTHAGSIGQLCNTQIAQHMNEVIANYHLDQAQRAEAALLQHAAACETLQ